MPSLNLEGLNVVISADGDAAVEELGKVSQTAVDAAKKIEQSGEAGGDAGAEIAAGAEKAEKALRDAGGAGTDAGAKIDKGAKTAHKSLDDLQKKLGDIGKKMTATVTLPIVGLFTAAVNGASDLNETVGKTQVVFGDYYGQIEKWSASAVENMGIAQSTALDMASLYGDMATGMGLSTDAAADMSMQLTQLAADLASFKNLSIDQAQTALKGVFTGETESLKNLGVVMTQTNLESFALSQGITKSVQSMSQAEQVALRYSYVMNATKNAQGDFARTGDSNANSMRKLTQTIKQLGESFGSLLIPAVTSVVQKLQGAAEWLMNLDDGAKSAILTIAAIAAAAGPLMLTISKTIKLVRSLKVALSALTINPVVLAIAGVAAVAATLAISMSKAKREVDETSESYQRMKNAIEKGASGGVTIDGEEIDEAESGFSTLKTKVEAGTKGVVHVTKTAIDTALEAFKNLKTAVEKGASGGVVIDGEEIGEAEGAFSSMKEKVEKGAKGAIHVTKTAIDTALEAFNNLKTAVEDGVPDVDVKASYTDDPEQMARFKSYYDKLLEIGWEPRSLSADANFTISGASTEEIEKYALELAAAATATGDFGEAVESLNKLLEQREQRQIDEVNRDAQERIKEQAIEFNSGIIDEATYTDNIKTIVDGASKAIDEIKALSETQQRANEIFNDGNRPNDYSEVAKQYAELYKDERLSAATGQAAQAELARAASEGEDLTQKTTEAAATLVNLRQTATDTYDAMTAAQKTYTDAVAQSDVEMKNAEKLEAEAQNAEKMAEMLYTAYMFRTQMEYDAESAIKAGSDWAVRIGQATAEEAEEFKSWVTSEDGSILDVAQSYNEIYGRIEDYKTKIEEAAKTTRENAEKQQQDAATAFMEQIAAIQSSTQLASDEITSILEQIQLAGVEVSDADKELIAGVQSMIESINTQFTGKGASIADEVADMVDGVDDAKKKAQNEGKDVGKAITDGVRAGILDTNSTNRVYKAVRDVVSKAISAARTAGDIHSPSRKTKALVGRELIRGIAAGVDDETPNAISAIKKSVKNIISGATAVTVSSGGVTAPAVNAGGGFDLAALRDAIVDAVTQRPAVFDINGRQFATATAGDNAVAANTAALRRNRAKGRW